MRVHFAAKGRDSRNVNVISSGVAKSRQVEAAYLAAKERYAEMGVDCEQAIKRLGRCALSLPCWQGDDLRGFEPDRAALGGGLAITGAYPGRARTPDELRADLEKACCLIPGRHRLNLHASYLEASSRVERDEIGPEHYRSWIDWAKSVGLGLDFNPTFFAHEKAADGFTLTHPDAAIRQFWVGHGIACRKVGAVFGEKLGGSCVTNVWIPDGFKDLPVDRGAPRQRLLESLDAIFAEPLDPRHHLDAVEPKLFGIGTESYVAGSHEFYLGYAITRRKILCIDTGHFHPTESVADKISAVLLHVPAILLHVSRGVRWDSDHVVTWTDEVTLLAQELVRGDFLDRTHLGLDYFDASINRVAAWVIGARSFLHALLYAFLEPVERLRALEAEGDYTERLALLEALKAMPFGSVWDHVCERAGVPLSTAWIAEVRRYEHDILQARASTRNIAP
jgi:L-rhamnose isomerase